MNAKTKVVLLAVFLLLALGGFFWFLGGRNERGKTVTPALAFAPTVNDSAKDTDGDGLKDWEEPLYKTNPENPDTDGDGTLDGEEIAKGRDPLKPGPDDAIQNTAPLIPRSALEDESNLTKEFGRIFFENYLKEKITNPNSSLTPDDAAQAVTESFFSQHGTRDIVFPAAPPSDIHVIDDNSRAAVERYGTSIMEIFHRDLAGTENPLLLFASILRRDDYQSQLFRFDPIIARYQKAYEDYKNLPVPSSWKDIHERMLNQILRIKTVVELLRDSDHDFMKALIAVTQYPDAVRTEQKLKQDMENRYAEISAASR